MASIGLRLDHSTGGTELATMLAKAMYGDPMDRYKAAQALSAIDLNSASIARTQGLTAAEAADAQRKEFDHNAAVATGPIYGKMAMDLQRQRQEQADAAAAPAVVEPFQPPIRPGQSFSGVRPATLPPVEVAPAPTVDMRQPMPDLFGSDAPVPVGPDASSLATTPPELRPQIAPTLPVVAEGRPRVRAGLPEPDFRLPGSYAYDLANHVGSTPPVPLDQQNEPDVRLSSWAVNPPQAPLTRRLLDAVGLGYGGGLVNTGQQVNVPGRPMPPVPIGEMEGAPSMTIPGRVGTTPIAPEPDIRVATSSPNDAPLPVGPDASVLATPPPELNTIPRAGVEPQAPEAVGPRQGPLPQQPQGTPTSQPPAQSAVLALAKPPANVKPGETVDNGDGTVSHGGPNGRVNLTQEQANALGLSWALNNDPSGQAAKGLGTVGLIYGNNSMTPTQTAATLETGSVPGQSSVLGVDETIKVNAAKSAADAANDPMKSITEVGGRKYYLLPDPANPTGHRLELVPGQPGPPGPLEGPGDKDTKAYTFLDQMGEKMRRGETLTEGEIQTISDSNQILRPRRDTSGLTKEGYKVNVNQMAPAGDLITPEMAKEYNARHGGQPYTPPAPDTGVTTATAPGVPASPNAPTTTTVTDDGTLPLNVPVTRNGVTTTRTSDTVPTGAQAATAITRLGTAAEPINYFRHLKIEDIPKPIQMAMQKPNQPALWQALIDADPKAREFMINAAALEDVVVHIGTGAAASPGEVANAVLQAIPRPGDDKHIADVKMRQVLNELRAQRATMIGDTNPSALAIVDEMYKRNGYDLLTGTETAGAASPANGGGGDKAVVQPPPPAGVKQADWDKKWKKIVEQGNAHLFTGETP